MIVIEGTDCVGKTTLARKLVERLNFFSDGKLGENWFYAHLSSPSDGWDYYWDYVRLMQQNIILDRFYMSELAYRTVKEDTTPRINPDHIPFLEAGLLMMGAVTVVLVGDHTEITARYSEKPEMFKLDKVLAVNEWFRWSTMGHSKHLIHAAMPNSLYPDDAFINTIIEAVYQQRQVVYELNKRMR